MTNGNSEFWDKASKFQGLLTWIIAGGILIVSSWAVQSSSVNAIGDKLNEIQIGGTDLAIKTSARVDVLEQRFQMHMDSDARRMDEINKKLDTLIGLHTKP
jgi:hypothetical protein